MAPQARFVSRINTMNRKIQSIVPATALLLAMATLALPAWAERSEGPSHGHGRDHGERYEGDFRPGHNRDEERMRSLPGRPEYGERMHAPRQPMVEMRFSDGDRRFVYEYYSGQWRAGRCPPGLAKKGNGCVPPGQARVWMMGRPLPMNVQRYPLPGEVLIRLPMPPVGYEFVRVASDILLIAVGTGIVVDAVMDLGF